MSKVNTEIAYSCIRKKILSGILAPGQSLMTGALAKEIGVSRTPIRDALRLLEVDGLVTIRSRLGASVKEMDAKELREMCGLRLALEGYAAGLAAANRTETDLLEMRSALEEMRSLTNRIKHVAKDLPLITELVRQDIRFHIAVMTAAHNELLKKEILRLHLINRVVGGSAPAKKDEDKHARDERRESVMFSHQEIFDAIERRDVNKSKSAMENHIQDIIDFNLRLASVTGKPSHTKELTEDELQYIS